MLNAGVVALVVLPLLLAIVYKFPPCLPALRAHGGFVHSFLHKSLGLRLSDLCVLCRNIVSKTIFKKGGASGLACEWARVPKAQKNP